jgi:membrane protein YqaA with SNARE-associated domain
MRVPAAVIASVGTEIWWLSEEVTYLLLFISSFVSHVRFPSPSFIQPFVAPKP